MISSRLDPHAAARIASKNFGVSFCLHNDGQPTSYTSSSELSTPSRARWGVLASKLLRFRSRVDKSYLHLDYAAQVWDPYLQKDVQLLENTQKFALKLISHNWSTSYQDLLSLSDLPTLSTRRLHLKLSQVYKIVYNLCHFPDHIFEERQAYSERLRRPLTLHQPFAHSNAYLNSFVPSSVQAWNNLTEQQVTCPSLKSFKSSLL